LDELQDIDFALEGIFGRLEPGTKQLSQHERLHLDWGCGGIGAGIGAQLRKGPFTGMVQVVTPIKDGPAYRAGVRAGDFLIAIGREMDSNGQPLAKAEWLPVCGLSFEDVQRKLHGKSGTKLKLTLQREGADAVTDVEVTRGRAQEETLFGLRRNADDTPNFLADPERKIAYVRLSQFTKDTAADLSRVLADLDQAGVRGLILDLRFNPGGLLTSTREVAELFVGDGLIMSIRPRVGREYCYIGKGEGSYLNFPMVCLVNGSCVMSSEFLAACLQDHKRAVIMGERTAGVAGVQSITRCRGCEIQYTTAVFCRPSGRNLAKIMTSGNEDEDWGVVPDPGFALKLSDKERAELAEHLRILETIPHQGRPAKDAKPRFKDRQLDMALEYLRREVKRKG
jgi:C-terminal peptidase prc